MNEKLKMPEQVPAPISNVLPDAMRLVTLLPDAMRLVTPAVAAEILNTTEGTLAVWRCEKRWGLPFVKIGGKVFYRMIDIQSFIESRVQSGTSELPPPPTSRTRRRHGRS
jgi:hypothetical protein